MLERHPDLDWGLVVARAQAARLRGVLYAALLLAQRALGAEPPPEVMERLRPGPLRRAALSRALGPSRALKIVTEESRPAGPGQLPFRCAWMLCGDGAFGPARMAWSRFWRHQDEVWATEEGVPNWARSRPLYAGYRIATLAGRVAATAVRGGRGDNSREDGTRS